MCHHSLFFSLVLQTGWEGTIFEPDPRVEMGSFEKRSFRKLVRYFISFPFCYFMERKFWTLSVSISRSPMPSKSRTYLHCMRKCCMFHYRIIQIIKQTALQDSDVLVLSNFIQSTFRLGEGISSWLLRQNWMKSSAIVTICLINVLRFCFEAYGSSDRWWNKMTGPQFSEQCFQVSTWKFRLYSERETNAWWRILVCGYSFKTNWQTSEKEEEEEEENM
jgi:hypothetical protein